MVVTWRDPQVVEQTGLEIPEAGWLKPLPVAPACDHIGPYVVTTTTKAGVRSKLVKCNRPVHSDGHHRHSSVDKGPKYIWTPEGERVHPE